LGCPKNLVDSEVMLGLTEAAGHEITPDAAAADVLVVNTCAFIDAAKRESIDAILEMAAHKRTGRCRRLVVTGCLAERYRDELAREIPEIDALLGTGDVPRIVDAIAGRAGVTDATPPGGSEIPSSPVTFFRPRKPEASRPLPTYIYDADTPRRLATPAHYAYVKIAEGCDYACSFCIIPRLRGPYRSRPAESILREARALASRGVRELILVSQDTTFYGIDRSERGALAHLLRALDTVDGLAWIRLLYLYPTTIGDDVLDAMAECEKVCRYIDLPLQHASDDVLRRMRRPGTRRTYERLLDRIRRRVPGVTLRTTFIVGFPGETERDFRELCDFVREMAFDHVGVFTYSHEEGTAAGALADDVPARVKRERRGRLMALQHRLVTRRLRARVGSRLRVLVDGPSPEHPLALQGRHEGQAPEIDPVVYLTDADAGDLTPGRLVEAEVVDARGYDLVARPCAAG
ncbi:MAG TPA: 30S ribosomal protein S12 methylthiotransferase RimO, partial [Vicinamibacterales bacterium]|nr:30S ribosomal protein S12 methylthiotransferase RimO [Vicinamibacterales bacterium]